METIKNHFSICRGRRICFWLSFIPAGALYYSFAATLLSPVYKGQAVVLVMLILPAFMFLCFQIVLATFAFIKYQK